MTQDEIDFIKLVMNKHPDESIRDVINRCPIHHKRCWYFLEKWCFKGFYDFGVTLDLGWLTEKGKEHFASMIND